MTSEQAKRGKIMDSERCVMSAIKTCYLLESKQFDDAASLNGALWSIVRFFGKTNIGKSANAMLTGFYCAQDSSTLAMYLYEAQ